jgi:hypothetical protein
MKTAAREGSTELDGIKRDKETEEEDIRLLEREEKKRSSRSMLKMMIRVKRMKAGLIDEKESIASRA